MKTTSIIAIASAGLLTIGLAGCADASGSSGSRVKLYDSVPTLAGDSSIVISGTVESQKTANDIPNGGDFTLSTVEVAATAKSDAAHPAGSSVVVRQHGSQKTPGPGALLETGKTYLLYLTPSGLDGQLASQFYITGGTAGVYETQQNAGARSTGNVTEDTEFTKAPSDEGDTLPTELTLADALNG
ncbi:hypothetical protein ACLBWP_10305 [Microbacterium sp. M1A1_1b]